MFPIISYNSSYVRSIRLIVTASKILFCFLMMFLCGVTEYVCNVPMTINNPQKVKDFQLTSSSFYRESTAAYYGRLYNDYSAWVPQ